MWWHTTETVFEIFKLSILLFILTLKLKSEFSNVLVFIPKPSDPNYKTFLPIGSIESSVKNLNRWNADEILILSIEKLFSLNVNEPFST